MNRLNKNLILTILALAIFFTSCRKEKLNYDVPETYSFENVNYSGQSTRLDMAEEMIAYIETGNTMGTVLDAQHLRDMFENNNDPFSFTATKQLKDKCFLSFVGTLESYFDSVALASTSTVAGSNGTAGVVESNDGLKQYLLSASGMDYKEIIEKSMMGAIFYYQATAVYLSESKIGDGVDNETVTPGDGTPMEHHWDEAFGYLGVPIDFPLNLDVRYWGEYSNDLDAILGTNSSIMNAFILGRAAISNDDAKTRDEQVVIIRDTWEKIAAGAAIHELNEAKEYIADDARRNHVLSEAFGFVNSLRYNPTKKISDTEIQTVLDFIGSNFYEITLSDIDNARNTLSSIYELDTVKDQL